MNPISDNTKGAFLMMGSMAAFTVNDAFVKSLGGTMPLSQILVLRGIIATIALLIMARAFGVFRLRLGARNWGLIWLRALAEVGAAFFFLNALIRMPIANVTALLQMLPLTLTLCGALLLGERVGWRRWAAVALGFVGMLMIVRPATDGFTIWSVYALIAVGFVTVRDLIVRQIGRDVPSLMITVAGSLAVLVFSGLWSLAEDWVPLTTQAAWKIGASGGFILVAYLLSVLVMRVGEVSVVAPFRFTALIWALALGWLAFGEWPAPMSLAGGALIVVTGVFTLLRERAVKRKARRIAAQRVV